MQVPHTNARGQKVEVQALHVYTFDPRKVKSGDSNRSRTQALYDLGEWRKHYAVAVVERSIQAGKARGALWCVTLSAKVSK